MYTLTQLRVTPQTATDQVIPFTLNRFDGSIIYPDDIYPTGTVRINLASMYWTGDGWDHYGGGTDICVVEPARDIMMLGTYTIRYIQGTTAPTLVAPGQKYVTRVYPYEIVDNNEVIIGPTSMFLIDVVRSLESMDAEISALLFGSKQLSISGGELYCTYRDAAGGFVCKKRLRTIDNTPITKVPGSFIGIETLV